MINLPIWAVIPAPAVALLHDAHCDLVEHVVQVGRQRAGRRGVAGFERGQQISCRGLHFVEVRLKAFGPRCGADLLDDAGDRGGIRGLLASYNPFSHMLAIVREPALGREYDPLSLAICVAITLLVGTAATYLFRIARPWLIYRL